MPNPVRIWCISYISMKSIKFHIFLIVVACAVVMAVVNGRSQSERPARAQVKPAVRIAERSSSAEANRSASLSEAAVKNAALRNDLAWTFGGKEQRGWYLYDLLIARTLKTDHDPDTNDFANALTSWQKKTRLALTGVLDEDALMAMVSQWQGNRLANRTIADPDHLMTAPLSDFYDHERLVELRQVERSTYAAYKRMVAAAIADPSLKLARTPSGELAPGEKYLTDFLSEKKLWIGH